jgi:hypothetical protein
MESKANFPSNDFRANSCIPANGMWAIGHLPESPVPNCTPSEASKLEEPDS